MSYSRKLRRETGDSLFEKRQEGGGSRLRCGIRALPAVEIVGGVDVGEGLDLRERDCLSADAPPEGLGAAVVGVEGALDLLTKAGTRDGDEGMGAVGGLSEDGRGFRASEGDEQGAKFARGDGGHVACE